MILSNQRIAKNLPLQHHGALSWPRIDHSPVLCGTALILADCAAILLTAIASLSLLSILSVDRGAGAVWTIEINDFAIFFIGFPGYFAIKGRYSDRLPFWTEAQLVVCTSLTAFAIESALGIMSKNFTYRLPIIIALIVLPPLAMSANALVKLILSRTGTWMIPVVVIGNRQSIHAAEAALNSDMSLGFEIVGRLDPDAIMASTNALSLKTILSTYRARCLFIATDGADTQSRQMIECALRERIRFATLLQPSPACSFSARPTCFFSHDTTLLSFKNGLSRPLPRLAKATMDVLVALVVLIVTSPALIAISLAIMTDGGPVLFRQLRVGAGGRPFYCFKFRTMVANADQVLQEALARDPTLAAEWAARRKLTKDPRITRLGRFLRQTSLDELPQLVNVLRLDMSLVGPRPIVESEVCRYGEHIAQYYATRPGITGVWQVSGRSNTSYDRRVQLDVWYVNNWTFWQDIAVLMKTIPAVFRREGAC